MKKIRLFFLITILLSVISPYAFTEGDGEIIRGSEGTRILAENYGKFDEPWAMTFLPGGELLITEKPGNLILYKPETQNRISVSGVPAVAYGGQGGLGDVILHPDYEENQLIYLSYAEQGSSGRKGAAVARSRLITNNNQASLEDFEVIWRQSPKVSGSGHYSHRMAFDSK
jgi:glucose/arabinose dehydrogenase